MARPPPAPPYFDVHDDTPVEELTRMRVAAWREALHHTHENGRSFAKEFPIAAAQILEGIKSGVPVDFEGDRTVARTAENHHMTEEQEAKVRETIRADVRDLKKAEVHRPSSAPPNGWPRIDGRPLCVSPIGARPKKNSTKVRVIHDLSYPKHGDSVNAGIDDGSLDISSFGHAARIVVQLGRGTLLIKLDVEAAYKQVPVRKGDWHLLGFRFDGKFFYERVLPFGLRSSCRLWELFAHALHWMCERLQVDVPHFVVHYVDDFLFAVSPGPGSGEAATELLRQTLVLCQSLGIPMAEGKTEGPTTCLTYLGIELDTLRMQARLSQSKLDEMRQLIMAWKSRKHASLKELESLAGQLNFAAACVMPGRIYTRRIFRQIARLRAQLVSKRTGRPLGPRAPVKIPQYVHEDIDWWHRCLEQWNGVSLLYEQEWTDAPLIELFTDACATGFGAFFQGEWFAGTWNEEELAAAQRRTRYSMPFLELRAIVTAAATWGSRWAGKKITFRSDCKSAVDAVTDRQSSTDAQMHHIRELDQVAARHGFHYRLQHISGVANVVADALSRGDLQAFRVLRPNARPQPTPILRPSLPSLEERLDDSAPPPSPPRQRPHTPGRSRSTKTGAAGTGWTNPRRQ